MKDATEQPVEIMPMKEEHWPAVSFIYKQGIATGNATFETDCPDWLTWDMAHSKECRFIAVLNQHVAGWVALIPVSARAVYAGVAEASVYIHEEFRGQGIGSLLLEKLIMESEKIGIWTLQAGIFSENEASLHIHKINGFREVGIRERIGKMGDTWRDVILLERRSYITGV